MTARIAMAMAWLLLAAPSARADKLAWEHDYTNALAKATQSGQLLLVSFTADWCGYCRVMDESTFTDADVKRALAPVVRVKVNFDRNPELVARYGVRGIPAHFLVNGEERMLGSVSGYVDATAFRDWLTSRSGGEPGSEPVVAKPLPGAAPAPPSLDLPDDVPGKVAALFDQIAKQRGKAIEPWQRQLREIAGHSRGELIPYLADDRLLVRIIAANILREGAGSEFVYDAWAPAEARRAAIQRLTGAGAGLQPDGGSP